SNGYQNLRGAMDDVRIYNTALGPEDIIALAAMPPPPPAPVPTAPQNLAGGVPAAAALEWNPADGAETYHVQVSENSEFTTLAFEQSTITQDTATAAGLATGTQYFWRVRATNAAGDSEWSETWSFTTQAAADALVGHWKMDEGSGSALADASTRGNNAQITGEATWVPGIHGQALRFSGSGQYAAAPDHESLDISSAITLAAWVRPERISNQYLIKKADLHSTDGYELSLTNGSVFFRFN